MASNKGGSMLCAIWPLHVKDVPQCPSSQNKNLSPPWGKNVQLVKEYFVNQSDFEVLI